MIKKRLLSLTLLITMALGTVANAQEITGTGYGNVPIKYSKSSTFTVVLPDSIELNSEGKQDFEIYLSEYELANGEKVKVSPTTNTVTMESSPRIIEYTVDKNANSYKGLPDFPTYYYNQSYWFYNALDDYVLTKTESGDYYLYCLPRANRINYSSALYVDRYTEADIDHYLIRYNEGSVYKYEDRECTIETVQNVACNMQCYKFNKTANQWDYVNVNNNNCTFIEEDKTIILSTVEILDNEEEFVQYSKENISSENITITMENEYLVDNTPIKGSINGSNLTVGNWSGEVVFEISLVK